MQAFSLRRGSSPLIVSMPHVGTYIPPELAPRLTPQALTLADTDWHLPLVYDFLEALDATVIIATHSRLYIDLNRPPDNASLYPGQDVTGLVPVDTFRKETVYSGSVPDSDEIAARVTAVWQPYHQALGDEIARLRSENDRVVLWDAHSIASELPRFFEGRLTDLNFGSADGASCDSGLSDAILAPVTAQSEYTWVLNGRFTGGYITRSHGDPENGIHAIQLEMSQVIYMNETEPFDLRPDLAARLTPVLRHCLDNALAWAA